MKNDNRKFALMIELCDFGHKSPCYGSAHTYDRYGTEGHEKGRVVERMVACTNHAGYAATDEPPLFTLQMFPVSNEYLLPEE